MSLADLIRKRGTSRIATAIPATPAIQQAGMQPTVARIATIAVANPSANEPSTVKRWQAVPPASEPEPTPFAHELELVWLVSTIHSAQGDSEKVIAECVQDALARPEAALKCYRELLRRREQGTKHGD